LIPFVNIHTHQIDDNTEHLSIADWCTITLEQRNKLSLFSAGIHPWCIDEINANKQFQELKEQALKINCKAIGECGLDKLKGPSLSIQIPIFEKQIVLAIQLKKPVIVHCVQAFDVLCAIIKKYQNQTTFIIHGFNQNEQIALQLLKLGAYLSFGKALLNAKNERLKHIFVETPNLKLFLENDDALVSIEEIYKAASGAKKCELHVMKEIIFANYKKVFTHE
jgi:TatD DNase family protein